MSERARTPQEALMHEHDDEHDDCPDCASGDPSRLCVDCYAYAVQDER